MTDRKPGDLSEVLERIREFAAAVYPGWTDGGLTIRLADGSEAHFPIDKDSPQEEAR